MRADEYLVEEVKRLKEENEILKENLKNLNDDLTAQENKINQPDDGFIDTVNIYNNLGEIYCVECRGSYTIENELKNGNITTGDLKKMMEDDDFIFNYNNERAENQRILLIIIRNYHYNYVIRSKIGNVYLNIQISYDGKGIDVSSFDINNGTYFLDYDEAKKEAIKKLRKEIKIVLDKITNEEMKQYAEN